MKQDAFRDQVSHCDGSIVGDRPGAGPASWPGRGRRWVLAARRAECWSRSRRACRQAGGRGRWPPRPDVAGRGPVQGASREKPSLTFDRLDLLINNAGLAVNSPAGRLLPTWACSPAYHERQTSYGRGLLHLLCPAVPHRPPWAHRGSFPKPGWQGAASLQLTLHCQQVCHARLLSTPLRIRVETARVECDHHLVPTGW